MANFNQEKSGFSSLRYTTFMVARLNFLPVWNKELLTLHSVRIYLMNWQLVSSTFRKPISDNPLIMLAAWARLQDSNCTRTPRTQVFRSAVERSGFFFPRLQKSRSTAWHGIYSLATGGWSHVKRVPAEGAISWSLLVGLQNEVAGKLMKRSSFMTSDVISCVV